MDFNNNSGLTNEQVSLSDSQNNKKGFDIRNERFFGKHKVAVIQIAIVPGSKRR